jgi:hypothetical protein
MFPKPIVILSSMLLAATLLTACCVNDGRRNTPKLFVPGDYVGWVRIEYGVHGAEPLPDHWRLPPPMLWTRETIPASGLLKTSTGIDDLVAGELYVYDDNQSALATDKKILCHLTSAHNFRFTDPNETRSFITYFVGPESESYRCEELNRFRTEVRPPYAARDLTELPVVGNINAIHTP